MHLRPAVSWQHLPMVAFGRHSPTALSGGHLCSGLMESSSFLLSLQPSHPFQEIPGILPVNNFAASVHQDWLLCFVTRSSDWYSCFLRSWVVRKVIAPQFKCGHTPIGVERRLCWLGISSHYLLPWLVEGPGLSAMRQTGLSPLSVRLSGLTGRTRLS